MSVHLLKREQLIHAPLERVWNFFSSPYNLPKLTPPYMKFLVTSKEVKPNIYPGQIITYMVSPMMGIPLNWMTEITHVIPNQLFVDEQRIGPYKLWHHEHHFEQRKDGVLMTDIVHYALPLGFIGDIVHALWVKKQLSEIFDFRYEAVSSLFFKK